MRGRKRRESQGAVALLGLVFPSERKEASAEGQWGFFSMGRFAAAEMNIFTTALINPLSLSAAPGVGGTPEVSRGARTVSTAPLSC